MDALEADSRFTMSGNLASLGMHTSLWTTARKLDEEDNLYRFAGLATHTWFDDRLLRICKVCYVTCLDAVLTWHHNSLLIISPLLLPIICN